MIAGKSDKGEKDGDSGSEPNPPPQQSCVMKFEMSEDALSQVCKTLIDG